MTVVSQKQRLKAAKPLKEELMGWLGVQSVWFNSGDHTLHPVSYHKSVLVYFNYDRNLSITLHKQLYKANQTLKE